jgi:hypothetical protein
MISTDPARGIKLGYAEVSRIGQISVKCFARIRQLFALSVQLVHNALHSLQNDSCNHAPRSALLLLIHTHCYSRSKLIQFGTLL